MTRALFAVTMLTASAALAADPGYPWSGTTTLTAPDGSTLVWTVKPSPEGVEVDAHHPKWSFTHLAKRDGTPVSTVKTAGARTVRIDYHEGGATYAVQGARPVEVKGAHLWDGDALDARLAGVDWAKVKEVEFSVIDSDSKDGDVYPMVARDEGVEKCAKSPCRDVKVTLSGWRKPFGPTWHYRYGTGPGAPYLENESDGGKFTAR